VASASISQARPLGDAGALALVVLVTGSAAAAAARAWSVVGFMA